MIGPFFELNLFSYFNQNVSFYLENLEVVHFSSSLQPAGPENPD